MRREDLSDEQLHSTQALQQCMLRMLKAIDKVCREHGLTYYLLAGSCLGAVRHKGFIPWDDDADVGLPRPDYDKLIAHAAEWLPKPYELVSGRQDASYPYAFARIHDVGTTYILRRQFDFVGGLPVDVYPLDGMTDNWLRRKYHYIRFSATKKLLYFCLIDPYKHGHGLHSLLVRSIRRLCDSASLHRRLERIQSEFPYESSRLVADHDYKPSKGILPKEVFGKPQSLPFEDTELYTVSQTDRYLTHLYGDYMLPPDTVPPQNFRYLNLEKPFRDYKAEQVSQNNK